MPRPLDPTLNDRILSLLSTDRTMTVKSLLWRLGEVGTTEPTKLLRRHLKALEARGLTVQQPPSVAHGGIGWRRAFPGEREAKVSTSMPQSQRIERQLAGKALKRIAIQADLAKVLDGWDLEARRAIAERDAQANATKLGIVVQGDEENGKLSVLRTDMLLPKYKHIPGTTFTPATPKPGIYEFRNKLTGQIYVGQSLNVYTRRDCGGFGLGQCKNAYWKDGMWKNRCHRCSTPDATLPLYQSIREHGIDNFEWNLLERCEPWELNERELFYIAERINARPYEELTKITFNLIGINRYRIPFIYKDKDVNNPFIRFHHPQPDPNRKVKKQRKEAKRLSDVELKQVFTMRVEWGFKLKVIATVFGITPEGVSHAVNAVKRGRRAA